MDCGPGVNFSHVLLGKTSFFRIFRIFRSFPGPSHCPPGGGGPEETGNHAKNEKNAKKTCIVTKNAKKWSQGAKPVQKMRKIHFLN